MAIYREAPKYLRPRAPEIARTRETIRNTFVLSWKRKIPVNATPTLPILTKAIYVVPVGMDFIARLKR
jgi:hypothetical protein